MGYRAVVVAVVAVHFAFLAFVIAGGYLALRRRRLIWAHAAACAWAVAIVTWPGLLCPLTVAENWARRHAGMSSYTEGFIDRYVKGVLYPAGYTTAVQALVAVAVLTSWILWYRRWRAVHRPPAGAANPPATVADPPDGGATPVRPAGPDRAEPVR